MSLTCRADIDADYFAYADQDDIWESDKLERAVNWLKTVPDGVPALYGSRTLLVDTRNQHIGYSPLFERTPDFRKSERRCATRLLPGWGCQPIKLKTFCEAQALMPSAARKHSALRNGDA